MTRTLDAGTTRPALPGEQWGKFARAICESEGRNWLALDNPREDCERWFKAGHACAAAIAAEPPSPVPLSGETRKALEAAREALKLLADMTCCRGDDEYVWGVQAQVDAALASEVQGWRTPDYCYDPEDWETTFDWSDRGLIFEESKPWDIVEPKRIATLSKCRDRWVIAVPIEWDDDGEADEWEFRWFDSKEEAAVARLNAAPPAPEPRT